MQSKNRASRSDDSTKKTSVAWALGKNGKCKAPKKINGEQNC